MKYEKWCDSEIKSLSDLYCKGIKILEISNILNMTVSRVKSGLKKYCVSQRLFKDSNLNINKLSEIDLSYIAGIVDGEGCISINKRTTSLYGGEINPVYNVRLSVNNVDPNLINWLLDKVGCGKKNVRNKGGNRRIQYSWVLQQKPTMQLLDLIEKYSVIKKQQIVLVKNFRTTYKNSSFGKRGTPKYLVDLREDYYNKLKDLHHVVLIDKDKK